MSDLQSFLDVIGYEGQPFGVYYTNERPESGFTPDKQILPTPKGESEGMDLSTYRDNFACVLGKIWLARKRGDMAWFSNERFGCLGGALYLGFMEGPLEAVKKYVVFGERYMDTIEHMERYLEQAVPEQVQQKYCVFKPLDKFQDDEEPLLVSYFGRPEVMSGLTMLAPFVTGDMQAVVSPFGAGCSNLVGWPVHYLKQGEEKAVLGGWDPSCRKYLGVDEISFTVPWSMQQKFLDRWEDSFLTREAWPTVQRKIKRSSGMWV